MIVVFLRLEPTTFRFWGHAIHTANLKGLTVDWQILLYTHHGFFRTFLKMLGLYLYITLLIGHKFCNMLSILNKLTLQKELQNFVTKDVFWTKSKSTTATKQTMKHKNPSRSRKLNPRLLAPKADTVPLHHRVNWEYRL